MPRPGTNVRVGVVEPGFETVEFVLCDLDGVVWLARQVIPGAPDAIDRMRASGRRVLFVTNNSMSLVADQEQALADIGIAARGDVITSAQAAASLVETGERVHVCGGPGVTEAVVERGASIAAASDPADVVIVGMHHDFDYAGLAAASSAVRRGARFVATNDDATYPTPSGPTPGAGSIVAAVSTAAGAQPTVAGKPHRPMADLARQRCGERFSAGRVLMIGDRWSTDGRFADVLGCAFALVRTGVTEPGAEAGGIADIDEADLTGVADALLAG